MRNCQPMWSEPVATGPHPTRAGCTQGALPSVLHDTLCFSCTPTLLHHWAQIEEMRQNRDEEEQRAAAATEHMQELYAQIQTARRVNRFHSTEVHLQFQVRHELARGAPSS